ncbi:MAG TPA: hypothetical protein PKD04_07545 [Rhodocyclaceae bacterium]|jgi:hypothetical protein|nr:hypothetical protein [Betaproteobacteria bacterium]HMV00920.1 hypothetical protein [Rhodocyclaceae bacterium]HMV21017.1 hypothetical protein [Rhodocyclaceae bacterium]HNE42464.1 hypothetical protein [Rhodocyclaceae bacterium]HNL22441.1 hypothetical protein [Rhodocyclaceae bacterium]
MQYQVIVIFGKGVEFDYRIDRQDLAGRSADEARKWFDREFTALECEVATPTGKVLIIDRILCVARYAGADRFRGADPWAEQFARHTALILGRDLVRVDVATYTIGY